MKLHLLVAITAAVVAGGTALECWNIGLGKACTVSVLINRTHFLIVFLSKAFTCTHFRLSCFIAYTSRFVLNVS